MNVSFVAIYEHTTNGQTDKQTDTQKGKPVGDMLTENKGRL